MKENILVICFLSLQFSPSTSLSNLAILNGASNAAGGLNSGLGMISRSKSVNAVSQMLRGEDSAKIRESLAQAVTTLAVLDIGGGALVPVTHHIIEAITTDKSFEATMNAWGVYNQRLKDSFNAPFKKLSEIEVKRLLNIEKKKVLLAFKGDVAKLKSSSKTLKYINRAKRWFRVKAAAKILGPLFDTIGIGVNSWALSTAIRDCNESPKTCNRGAIASASLGIVSGVVGVGVFVASLVVSSSVAAVLGPVGAIVSLTLAICATLIELFYKPPVDEEAIAYRKKINMIQELDRFSRLQLYHANKFMANNKITRGDLYVANQGQLPRWTDPTKKLEFGLSDSENPRKTFIRPGLCEKPIIKNGPVSYRVPQIIKQCPLLVDGKNIKAQKGEDIGYGFYGYTTNARSMTKGEAEQHQPSEAYNGVMVLVNTNEVQSSKLKKEDLDETLRGIVIDTNKKGKYGVYDDVVALGNMNNLDSSATVTIKTGHGNDVLNIDGFVSVHGDKLHADLGLGYNTLSFLGLPDNEDSEIQGIEFNPRDNRLHYFTGRSRRKDIVGSVHGVSVLGASPFQDIVHLHSDYKKANGDDFPVIKFKGKATYVIDIDTVVSSLNWKQISSIPHFKIFDSTDNGQNGGDKCQNHKPLLKIINFGSQGVANDVLYDGRQIKIYGIDARQQKRNGNHTEDDSGLQLPARRCSGEPADGSHPMGGGGGKSLLVTVSFHTKCPGEVSAFNKNGGCMMAPRKVSELDLLFFNGDNLFTDFTQNVQSNYRNTRNVDVCTLKCPQHPVSRSTEIKLGQGDRDYLVIKNDLFLDPCGIDGEGADMILKRKKRGFFWELEFKGKHEKFTGAGKRHRLKGIEWIVNEYGEKIVNLRKVRKDEINLFDEYTRKTVTDIADRARREQTDEVADTLTQCLKTSGHIDANICKTN